VNVDSAPVSHQPSHQAINFISESTYSILIYRPHQPSPFIIITQPESVLLILLSHGEWKAELLKLGTAVRVYSACATLYHHGCCYKHNCPHWGLVSISDTAVGHVTTRPPQ